MLDDEVREAVLAFRRERDWEQFHSPLTLSVAIAVEAGELLEHFQWMTPGEVRPTDDARPDVELEIADLAILLSYLAHDLGIDVNAAVRRKLVLNAERYPVHKARGTAVKYDKL